ncbi:MAG: tryptophan synthase subunit alpha, partial [Elusimicrobia bacterium]|nr:tryptophan synthase subunit alpha [Elusimicrobiota bacterium]
DPTLEWTGRFLDALAEAGADVVELGVPFSDPVADGPVNQRAAERALGSGTTLTGILDAVAAWRRRGRTTPIVLFTYINPPLRMGLGRFAERCRDAGVQGVLPVDLPPEEAGEFRRVLAAARVGAVFLASPTTAVARMPLIAEAATGFVYYAARLGVTGESRTLSASLARELRCLKRHVRRPIAAGFGISTPAQAAAVGRLADGVVVGSALVRIVGEHPPREAARRLRKAAGAMVRAMEQEMMPC